MAAAIAAIDRLEDALSLFRDNSELRRLNRDKVLHSPSGDMRRALALALDIAGRSRGLFDPSVQALWEAHVDWFAEAPDAGLPPEEIIESASGGRLAPDSNRA
jgi:thiamine biosynthesis lipoprotein